MRLIFFIGMPGSGKTYWAEQIAEAYKLEYIDTDEIISLFEQRSIKEIFDEEGEEYFRHKEKELLESIFEEDCESVLVACGGGLPIFDNNLLRMKQHGCVVYLKASINKLHERIATDESRPLLKNIDQLHNDLLELLITREPYYLQADHTVNTDSATIDDFEKIIKLCTEQH